MLQAGWSRVRFPMRLLNFVFNFPNSSSRTMALASIQLLTEMSTRNLPGDKGQTAHKADTSPPSVTRLSKKCGRSDDSQTSGPPGPVTRIALPFCYIQF
jgi:hypothetical protein